MKKSKVYYDGNCYVCSFEIKAIRKKGNSCGIEFINISDSDFGFAYRDYSIEMIGEFNGIETVGVETFREMYDKIGFKKLVYFSRLPVVNKIFDLSYKLFAYYVRPLLPKKL
jgi:predicted DCC family thiol-disulfide oxidoreductase YuxK